MSAADNELFGIIYGVTDNPDWAVSEVHDAILAAGYMKPRTVTTEDELDTLPIGSVVLSEGRSFRGGFRMSFQRWDDGLWHRGARSASTHPDNFLPATVLHEGTQP